LEGSYRDDENRFHTYVMWPFFQTKFLFTEESAERIVSRGVAEANDPYHGTVRGTAYYKGACLIIDFCAPGDAEGAPYRRSNGDVLNDDDVFTNVWLHELAVQCDRRRTLIRAE